MHLHDLVILSPLTPPVGLKSPEIISNKTFRNILTFESGPVLMASDVSIVTQICEKTMKGDPAL